jgi:minichromosome maintenance protein 10
LRGRYYLSPSRLYSAVRLLPDKQGYDVPVPGDWITIAVVAERGPLKFSKAPVTVGPDEGIEKRGDWKSKGKGKAKEQAEASKPTGKKYVNLKLIDFGARSRSSSSASGGKAIIRGDAFLSLLLFESDGFDLITNDGDAKPHKVYRGGSRGAFEALSKIKEGDVIALLNPKILKPYQVGLVSPDFSESGNI